MKKITNFIKAFLTIGADDQAFIGAKWLVILLGVAPNFLRRKLALRILAISPHYFYRSYNPAYKDMPTGKFLEAEYERNRTSREKIINQILVPYLKPFDYVLDIGCGPGFLAKAVSKHVAKVYACDISQGVLKCAGIINGAGNIKYVHSSEAGFAQIPDSSLDLAYSFAVIQHVKESVIKSLFMSVGKKIRPGGRCVFQVQLDDGKWAQEKELAGDKSVTGRLRLKYGLNFFPRSEKFFRELAVQSGFALVSVRPLSELMSDSFDDIYHQHLIILEALPATQRVSVIPTLRALAPERTSPSNFLKPVLSK